MQITGTAKAKVSPAQFAAWLSAAVESKGVKYRARNVVSQAALPILLRCADSEADGSIVEFAETMPLRIIKMPVRQVLALPPSMRVDNDSHTMWAEQLRETAALITAISKQQQKKIDEIIERIDEPSLELDKLDNLMRYVAASLMTGLRKLGAVEFIVWTDKSGKVEGALLCADERVAAFATLLSKAELGAHKCARRGCNNPVPFNRWHPADFCSKRCKNAEIVAQWRSDPSNRERERKAAQKRQRSAKRRRAKAR